MGPKLHNESKEGRVGIGPFFGPIMRNKRKKGNEMVESFVGPDLVFEEERGSMMAKEDQLSVGLGMDLSEVNYSDGSGFPSVGQQFVLHCHFMAFFWFLLQIKHTLVKMVTRGNTSNVYDGKRLKFEDFSSTIRRNMEFIGPCSYDAFGASLSEEALDYFTG